MIDANQAGNSNYNPAPQAQQSFPVVNQPTPTAGCQDQRGAYNQGFNAGFSSGFDHGFNSGFNAGFRASFQSAFNDAFGSSARHTSGSGAASPTPLARAQAVPGQALPPACDQAFNQDFNTGFNSGFNTGFQARHHR